jgi:two-component system chemotaxis response regulator CheB
MQRIVKRESFGKEIPMPGQALIVIGASAGGLAALRALAAGLPADLRAPVCIVQHIGQHRSELPAILGAAGPLPAAHAEDGAPLANGHLYIAPPDRHLLVTNSHLHLTRGPRENFARPAIDPLFRSAAEAFGPNAIGVILTGNLNDGAAGLYELKRRGGIAVVQDPFDAENRDMPESVLAHVEVDYCMPIAEMAPLLARLAADTAGGLESEQAAEEMEMIEDRVMARPVTLTCPECGGAVEKRELGTLVQYRCHIGHVFTAQNMAAAQFEETEQGVEMALRLINERIEMCRQMAERPDVPDTAAKNAWYAAMREAEDRAAALNGFLSEGWLLPETE